ncbi:hypothetical protein K1719_009036 [Acacia pycnantha]|nr:hypothetical protein K1719_009036 [Acacia pycnantha]
MLHAIYPYDMTRLGQRKVFIVLDDTDDVEQLKILAKRHEFGSGNKILITTRDKQVVANEVDYTYVLEGLNDDETFDLFSIYAFGNDNVDPKIRELAVQDVIKLLDACGYSTISGLETLDDKALVDIHHGRIHMHHLIKEMGRQVVRDESLNGPKGAVGSETIEGITLNLSKVEDMCLSPQAFCSLPNLKFLDFHRNCNFDEEFPLKSLPAKFKAEHLVEIIMPYSNSTKLWDGVQNLMNLRKIDLDGSKDLIELPDLSKAKHLAEVYLDDSLKLQRVHPLTSNTHLKSRIDLDLQECSRLNKFLVTSENCEFELDLSRTPINDELCSSSGCLSKIYSLYLNKCENVKSLPYKLTDLQNLRRLEANGCTKLVPNLCSIFDEVRALEVLKLGDCSELFELPDNISLSSPLCELHLQDTNIETLPLSIKHLSSLQCLYLNRCKRLQSIPELPPSVSSMTTVICLSLGTLDFRLTNEGEEVKHIYDDYGHRQAALFNFLNCMKLDQQSIKAAMDKVVLGIHKGIYLKVYMLYPGKIVPKWFVNRTTQNNVVIIDLSLIPQPWDGNFIFCVVFSKSTTHTYIDATWFIDGEYACRVEASIGVEFTLSDHVYLCNDQNSFGEVQRKIAEKKRNAQTNTYHPSLEIAFRVECNWKEIRKIKEYGVCPTSALEYQNYIQQIQLPLQPHPKSVAMEAASQKRKYHSLLP